MRTEAERFWEKVDKRGPVPKHCRHLGRCWLWKGGMSLDGYGRFRKSARRGSGMLNAHRWSLEDSLGRSLAKSMHACHHCDNPACVRPTHLFAGTLQDNEDDKTAKGRRPCGDRHHSRLHPEVVPRGEDCVRAKLTDRAVRDIVRRSRAPRGIQVQLAREYGVTPTIVSRILSGKIWRHVTKRGPGHAETV